MRDEDLEWLAWPLRSPGGQHVVDSRCGVMVHHRPTGHAFVCATERSMLKNREKALFCLQATLGALSVA